MADPTTSEVMTGFRELLHEFRGIGEALGDVVERTARVEVKVDRLVVDQQQNSAIQAQVAELTHWFHSETAARNARGAQRGFWVGAIATLLGGALGTILGHLWR